MQSRIQDFESEDAQLLGVCVDSVEENARVVEQRELDFPILSDPEMVAIHAYGLLHQDALTATGNGNIARPAVYVIDREGVVQWRKLTDNWRIRVRPETVLEQLKKIP